jgi:signal transduction histidine kinase
MPLECKQPNSYLPAEHIKYCLLFFSLYLTQIAHSQTREIDSLRNSVYTERNEKKKLASLLLICEQANSIDQDSLFKYYSMAYACALREHSRIDIIQSNLYKATYLSKKGNPASAESIIDSCVSVLNRPEDRSLKFRFLVLKSNVLIRANKQKESVDNSLQLLHAAELSNDVATQIRAENNIGWAYMELDQDREALNWFFKAIDHEKDFDDDRRQPFIYSNIAAIYNTFKKNDSAEFFAQRALTIAQKRDDLSSQANAYFIYGGICSDIGNKTRSEQLMQKGLAIRKLIGDPFFIVSDIYQIGLLYARNSEPAKGIAILNEGITMARQSNLYEKLPILYSALAANYKAAGKLHQYSETLDTIITLKDSLYKTNSAEAFAEMQAKYDLQKKENTIIQQQYDLTRKNYFIYSIAALLVAILLFGYIFWENRKKIQRLKIASLKMEQKKKTTQAVVQAEEDERKRIAADLHDSVAQKMVVAKINLEALGNRLNALHPADQKIYDNVAALLEESTDEVRKLSHSMMPQAFARDGLVNAVRDLLDKISKRDLRISFNAEGNFGLLREDAALMVYRIMQECIQNVLKHAHAKRLDISMSATNTEADVTIEDDGIGFKTADIHKESTGLRNIRSRIEYLNGKIDINSGPGKGTAVAFYFPLHGSGQ